MSRNLAELNEIVRRTAMKRLRKANKFAKEIAHGGWSEEAKNAYLNEWPEAKTDFKAKIYFGDK